MFKLVSVFDDYQEFCNKKLRRGNDLKVFLLGLAEETGEVLGLFKKAFRDEREVDLKLVKEELGDTMWYIGNICNATGLSLDSVIVGNIQKLNERYKDE